MVIQSSHAAHPGRWLALAASLTLLSAGAVHAQVDTAEWSVVAIGMVLVPSDSDPIETPPEPDPGLLDPGQLIPGDPTAITTCSSFLQEFLGNTEYLGPLLDFATCSQDAATTYAMEEILGIEGFFEDVSSYVGELQPYVLGLPGVLPTNVTAQSLFVCTVQSGARKAGNRNIRIEGDTSCVSLASAPNPATDVLVDGSAQMLGFLYGESYANTSTVSGNGSVAVRATRKNPTSGAVLKTKYFSDITLPTPSSCISGSCQFGWVVVPNKNVNTGATLPCQLPNGPTNSSRLMCEIDSLPYFLMMLG